MIHVFTRAGLDLALDVGSGAVHVVDAPTRALLQRVPEPEWKTGARKTDLADLYAQFGRQSVDEADEAILETTRQGLLFSVDDYTEFSTALGPAPVKAICLHMAHDCNLRCRYCFASTGDFGGARSLMPLEIAQKSIDFLIAHSEDRRNLEVDFFGGEPLMNFDVVRQTVAYARALEQKHNKNFRFTITTNGILLDDEKTAYINANMKNVVLSLDGRKSVNDSMRPTQNQKGSYDIVLPKMQRMVAARNGGEYYVRGTYTRGNLDFDADVLALFEAGFEQISVEPVVVPDEAEFSIRDQDVEAIEQAYERLLDEMIKRRAGKRPTFNFFHFMVDLDNGPCAIKRLKGCGSGNEYVAVTPEGKLYPCHQFVGDDDFLMGSVATGIEREDIKRTFADANLLKKETCQDCWAKYFCSGGCNANNYGFNGSIEQPHELSCRLERIRLECAIALQATRQIQYDD